MKARNILVLYASLLLICTLEILGTPVRNLPNAESGLKHLLQIRSAADEVEKVAYSRSLIDLIKPELLSYIEDHKQKPDLEEPSTKEVRASELDSKISEENEVKSLSLSDLVDPVLLSYIEGQEQKLEESNTEEVRANEPPKPNCKGAKPTTTKKPEKPKPHCKGKPTTKKPVPPKKFKPLYPKFHGFNSPSINRDCIIGDLILSPEECISFLKRSNGIFFK